MHKTHESKESKEKKIEPKDKFNTKSVIECVSVCVVPEMTMKTSSAFVWN